MSDRLTKLDHAHVWHPFTPMRQWRQTRPTIIERAEGFHLIDTDGRRYIDGVSSLWCNLHGHRVKAIDDAIRAQLDKVAHTTLLGLASVPSIELAARLAQLTDQKLPRVFFSDAGATAVEAALKIAVGYWHYRGKQSKNRFIALGGAYHGDTVGAMAVGYDDVFHRPYASLIFPTHFAPPPDALRAGDIIGDIIKNSQHHSPHGRPWPSEDSAVLDPLTQRCLHELENLLVRHQGEVAAVILEPVMQGAAGMICQPPGFVKAVAELARAHDALLIADEVATGFGRTGRMFACQHDGVTPDIMCLAKGLTGGYLPLAATLVSEEVESAFLGQPGQFKGFLHGHTYTGNALGCAAALASLDLIEQTSLIEHINQSATLARGKLDALRDCPHVVDVRQRGLMIGIELGDANHGRQALDYTRRSGAQVCAAMRDKGLFVRPLGDAIVLMPIPAMPHNLLEEMLDIVVTCVLNWQSIPSSA